MTYYIIFTQGIQLISRFLKPNFSHIYFLVNDGFNWMIINPARLYMQIEIPPVQQHHDLVEAMTDCQDTVIEIKFKSQRDSTQVFGRMGLLSCVTMAKYILGLRVNCITPFGLCKKLLTITSADYKKHGIESIRRIKGYQHYVRRLI